MIQVIKDKNKFTDELRIFESYYNSGKPVLMSDVTSDTIHALFTLTQHKNANMMVVTATKEKMYLWRRISFKYGIKIHAIYYSMLTNANVEEGGDVLLDAYQHDMLIFDQFYSGIGQTRKKVVKKLTMNLEESSTRIIIFTNERDMYFPENMKKGVEDGLQ